MAKIDDCERWLRSYMQRHGSVKSADVKAEAAKFGYSEDSLHHARGRIAEIEIATGGFPRRSTWVWSGPEPSVPPLAPEPPKKKQERLRPLKFSVEQFTAEAHRQAVARRHYRPPPDRWPL